MCVTKAVKASVYQYKKFYLLGTTFLVVCSHVDVFAWNTVYSAHAAGFGGKESFLQGFAQHFINCNYKISLFFKVKKSIQSFDISLFEIENRLKFTKN